MVQTDTYRLVAAIVSILLWEGLHFL